MNTEIFESKLDAIIDKLKESVKDLESEAESLEAKAQDKRKEAERKEEEIQNILEVSSLSLELLAYTKSLEGMRINALNKAKVTEVLDDLETQETPDFKSARDKLGIEDIEKEDSPPQEALTGT